MHTSNTNHHSTMDRFVKYTDNKFDQIQSDTTSQITQLTQAIAHDQMYTEQFSLLRSNVQNMDSASQGSPNNVRNINTAYDKGCQLPSSKPTPKPNSKGSEHSVHASSANGAWVTWVRPDWAWGLKTKWRYRRNAPWLKMHGGVMTYKFS
jgi:hypothetical protein